MFYKLSLCASMDAVVISINNRGMAIAYIRSSKRSRALTNERAKFDFDRFRYGMPEEKDTL